MPRAVPGFDGIGELIVFADQQPVGAKENVRSSCQEDERDHAEDWPQDCGHEQFRTDRAVLQPAISHEHEDDRHPDEERILLRQHEQGQGRGVTSQPAPMPWSLQTFPQHPDREQRPESEKAIH